MAITSDTQSLFVPNASGDLSNHVVDDVVQVVEIAMHAEGILLEPAAVAHTAKRVNADLGFGKHPFVVLAATCVEHGLGPTALRGQPSDLVERIDEGMTVVVERPHGAPGFYVLSAPTGKSEVVAYDVVDGSARRLARSVERSLRDLGDGPIDALAIEPSFPLDVMRGPNGARSGPFQKLWALARLERSELTTVLIYAVFIGILTLVTPVSLQALVSTIAFGSVLQPLIILGLALFAGLVLSAALQTLRVYVVEIIQRRVFARVVNDFAQRLPRLSAEVRRERDLRELSNRFFDVMTLQKSAAVLAVDTVGLTLQTTMGLLLLAFYHPVLLALDVVLVLLLVALIIVPLSSGATTAIYESKAKYATVAWLQTIAEHPNLFSDARGARRASAHAHALSRLYVEKRAEHWRQLLRQIAGGLSLQVLAAVALLLIGGWLVIERQLTLGQLVASELVVAVVGTGFAKLGKQMEKLYDAAAAVDKLGQVVEAPRERDGGLHIASDLPARVELRQLADPRIVNDIDLVVEQGETVAIAGGPATGKSTLLQMMMGQTDPARGSVRIDGVELSQAHLPHYRMSVCWLDADARAPDMTIAELLALHAPAASTTEIRDVLAWVGLEDAVERLPEGIDQKLLPNGAPLSRNEMLRLSIARLLLQAPRLALIDGTLDAFADQPTLLDAVLGGPWTTIVTTSSPAIIARAGRALHLARMQPEETA